MTGHRFLAAGVGVVAYVAASAAAAAVLCDNFGREWDFNVGACPAEAGLPAWTKCVTGARDINNELGCGRLALDGIVVLGVMSVTAYDTPSDDCVSAHWKGRKPFGSKVYTGVVSNEFGPFGPFTLGPCVEGTNAEGDSDPAQP